MTDAVVLGAGGLLGRALVATLPLEGYRIVAAYRGRGELDIADEQAVTAMLARDQPAVVFNAAAYTDVDGAEDDPAAATRANVTGPALLARASATRDVRLVHYSTDFVFDGERETPYDESAPTSPQAVYARSKREGELRVLELAPRAQVVRVGCLYGSGGRNFPSSLLGRLRAGQAIRADNQRRVSPTWVGEVAALSGRLARHRPATGLFHATAQGETTWAEFAQAMARLTGLPSTVEAVAGNTLALKAPRPRRPVLISRRLGEYGLAPPPPWPVQLQAYLGSEGVPVR